MLWFLEHPLAISTADSFLLDFEEDDIQRMPSMVCKHRVQQLEIAMQAYERDRVIRSTGQSIITDFFHKLRVDTREATEINE